MSSTQRLRKIYQAIGQKESDFTIDTDERGEIIIYTGLVENKGRLRLANEEERHDYDIVQKIIQEENIR